MAAYVAVTGGSAGAARQPASNITSAINRLFFFIRGDYNRRGPDAAGRLPGGGKPGQPPRGEAENCHQFRYPSDSILPVCLKLTCVIAAIRVCPAPRLIARIIAFGKDIWVPMRVIPGQVPWTGKHGLLSFLNNILGARCRWACAEMRRNRREVFLRVGSPQALPYN